MSAYPKWSSLCLKSRVFGNFNHALQLIHYRKTMLARQRHKYHGILITIMR